MNASCTIRLWDFENRLSSVTLPNNGGVISFRYDPFGRRIQKTSASRVTNYLYDGSNIVAEVSASGGVVASYTQGAGTDEPLAMQRGGNTVYYHADGLGSVTSLTDPNAKTVATYVYDSFGNTTATASIFNPLTHSATPVAKTIASAGSITIAPDTTIPRWVGSSLKTQPDLRAVARTSMSTL